MGKLVVSRERMGAGGLPLAKFLGSYTLELGKCLFSKEGKVTPPPNLFYLKFEDSVRRSIKCYSLSEIKIHT